MDEPGALRQTIQDFLSDGSLAQVCAQLSEILGTSVELRDRDIRRIVAGDDPPWRTIEGGPPPAPDATRITIEVEDVAVGSFHLRESDLQPAVAEAVVRALGWLAKTAGEICAHDLEIRRQLKEIDVLQRLSAMLVRVGNVSGIVETALDSALDVLGLDAGSVVVFPDEAMMGEDESDLQLVASRHLSEQWLRDPVPLSHNREFDRRALDGEIVTVEDIQADDRIAVRDEASEEGLGSFISAGLVFRSQPVGVMRLFGRRPRSFSASHRRILRAIGQQAAVAIEQAKLLETQRAERQYQRQLALAADVQRRMLPDQGPSIPSLDIAARYVPSLELGGDFYDLFEVADRLAITIGDVVGKGVPAALQMSAIRATLRSHALQDPTVARVMGSVNEALCRDSQDGEFATIWYGVLDPLRRVLTYTSAGHDQPIHVRGGQLHELTTDGLVVGIDPAHVYMAHQVHLEPGDLLLAYTDGLPDAQNFDGERFTKRRLFDVVRAYIADTPDVTADKLLEHVMWHLRQHVGLARRVDDQTLVVVRVKA